MNKYFDATSKLDMDGSSGTIKLWQKPHDIEKKGGEQDEQGVLQSP